MKIQCPITHCNAQNNLPVNECDQCGIDLRAYAASLKLADFYFNKALIQAEEGDLKGAQGNLSVCLGLKPDDYEARLLLGRIIMDAGDRKSARAVWERLLQKTDDEELCRQANQCLEASSEKSPGRGRGKRSKGRRRSKKKKHRK